jgi:hypothetical protein
MHNTIAETAVERAAGGKVNAATGQKREKCPADTLGESGVVRIL